MIKYIAYYGRSVLVLSCSGHGKLFLQHRIWPAWNVDTSSVPPVGLITLLPKSWMRAWDKPFHVPPMVVIYLLMMPQSCKLLDQTCHQQNFVLVYEYMIRSRSRSFGSFIINHLVYEFWMLECFLKHVMCVLEMFMIACCQNEYLLWNVWGLFVQSSQNSLCIFEFKSTINFSFRLYFFLKL